MIQPAPYILGIGGTLRTPSSSERLLRIALAAAAARGARVECVSGTDLVMPMFDPHMAERTPAAAALVRKMAEADGIILSSPGYHGSISGLIKNAIDYVEDLRDASPPYFDGKAIGCIACGAGWQAAGATLTTLRSIVHALRGWPTPLGILANTVTMRFEADGSVTDQSVQAQLQLMGGQVVDFAAMRAATASSRNPLRQIAS